jgi:hypothetical protein
VLPGERGPPAHARRGANLAPAVHRAAAGRPRTFRATESHCALHGRTVGSNPFEFFAPHGGIDAWRSGRGGSIHALALQGHDQRSGLPSFGVDATLAIVQRLRRNGKLTSEAAISHGTHTVNAALLFAC